MIKLLGFGTILSKLIAFIIPFLLKAPVNHFTNYKSNRFLFAYKKKVIYSYLGVFTDLTWNKCLLIGILKIIFTCPLIKDQSGIYNIPSQVFHNYISISHLNHIYLGIVYLNMLCKHPYIGTDQKMT